MHNDTKNELSPEEKQKQLLDSFGALPDPKSSYSFDDLLSIMEQLRAESGCDWDRAQTHKTLIPYLKEESQEVIDAIQKEDTENLCEELGDLLFQIVFHTQIACEENHFTMEDVISGICRKMIRRHPFVFGENPHPLTVEENEILWKYIKTLEKRTD